MEITGGAKCDVVYDSVGKDTFPGSLDCLKPLGMWVSFGQSSGMVPPFPISLLQQKGGLFATRPTTAHYFARREDLETGAANLFKVLLDGTVKVEIGATFPLKSSGRGPSCAGSPPDDGRHRAYSMIRIVPQNRAALMKFGV